MADQVNSLSLRSWFDKLTTNGMDSLRYCFAAWIASQTRCGVAGMSMYLTFAEARASCTAFISAAGAPIAPASPQPLAPSGLCVHGVTFVATLKEGRCAARGIA